MSSHKTSNAGLVLLAATTLVVAACSRNSDDDRPVPPAPVNSAPVISGIADRTSNQDTVVGPIDFSIGDRETDAPMLTVSATADGTSVVPADGIALGGTGAV